jgi:hypothetical protein
MSFDECIINGQREGSITDDQARYARDLFEQNRADMIEELGAEGAAAAAARETFDQLKYEAARKKQLALLKIKKFKELNERLKNTTGLVTGDAQRPGLALQAMVAIDESMKRFDSNLHSNYEATRRTALSRFSDGLRANRETITGRQGRAEELDLLKEVFGEDTGLASAKLIAQQWKDTAEYLRLRANAAGMAIANRKNWNLPQTHNSTLVREAGATEWMNFVRDKLDLEKMVNERTGRAFTKEELELALRDVHETIAQDGLNKIKPGQTGQPASLANRRMDHRFLVFKDADTWMQYQERFGDPDVFNTMMSHIDSMSKDIALLETFGPNPKHTIEALKIEAQRIANNDGRKATAALQADAYQFDTMLKLFTGEGNIPASEWLANTGGTLRNTLQASLLGGVPIIAIPGDLNTARIAAQMAGIPTNRIIRRAFSQFIAPLSAQEKTQFAVKLGLGADNWMNLAQSQARFFGEVSGPEISQQISDKVLRGVGLSHWTQAARQTFGIEFLGWLGDQAGRKFDDLPDTTRNTLEKYGIGSDRWDIIRNSKLEDYKGNKFVRPTNIEDRTDLKPGLGREIATQILTMIEQETTQAVPQATIRSRAFLRGGTTKGTLAGEIIEGFAQFKSFPTTIIQNNLQRYMTLEGWGNKVQYGLDFMVTMAIAGGLGLQGREMLKGRDPMDMSDPKFWGKAILTGGGMGIIGDFLFSQRNEYGRGLGATVAGPQVGLLNDFLNLTIGNAYQLSMGEETKFGRESVNFLQRYFPGSSAWYGRLALERLVWDNLKKMVDPEADASFRRFQRKRLREFNQEHWWAPGENLPERAPEYPG